MKNCDNCYWKNYKDKFCFDKEYKPVENVCDKHSFLCEKCDSSDAEYKYKGVHYCSECIINAFGVEESTVTHYYHDGEYLGNDEDFNEVISNLNIDIEFL